MGGRRCFCTHIWNYAIDTKFLDIIWALNKDHRITIFFISNDLYCRSVYSPLPYSSYVYICIDLYLFSLLHFTWHILYSELYIYSHISWILLGGMNGPPPPQELGFHPDDDTFDPDVAIPNHPISAILWNIFQHLIFGC